MRPGTPAFQPGEKRFAAGVERPPGIEILFLPAMLLWSGEGDAVFNHVGSFVHKNEERRITNKECKSRNTRERKREEDRTRRHDEF